MTLVGLCLFPCVVASQLALDTSDKNVYAANEAHRVWVATRDIDDKPVRSLLCVLRPKGTEQVSPTRMGGWLACLVVGDVKVLSQ